MIDAKRIDALLKKLSVPEKSSRADDIRLMIDEAVRYAATTQSLTPNDLSLSGEREAEDAAWITIEPGHVSFYV